jgi:hypothetical protein
MQNEFLGFEYQPDIEGSCGAYSLGHTLNLIGVPNTIDNTKMMCRYVSPSESVMKTIKKVLGGKWIEIIDPLGEVGTEESGIKSGLKKSGCQPIILNTEHSKKARTFIDKNLSLGNPIIMSVNWDYNEEDLGHWMVCAGKYKNKYIVIDSAPLEDDTEKIDLYNWVELEDRFVWFEEDDDEDGYYEFNLIAAKSSASPSCVKQMNNIFPYLIEDEDLQEWWGYYLNDLLDVSEYDYGINKGSIQLSELINKHYDSIIESLVFWFEEIDLDDLEYEIGNYILVAKAYQLSVPERKREEALISFTSALVGTLIY